MRANPCKDRRKNVNEEKYIRKGVIRIVELASMQHECSYYVVFP